MGTILGAILAVESVALLLLFPKLKLRMLQRKEFRERFLRSLDRPRPVPSPHRRQPTVTTSANRSQLLISRDTRPNPNIPKQNAETAITAVKNYMGFDTREEAEAIYEQAQNGNPVAQFLVGMALQRSGSPGANAWLRLSAQQNFGPAQDHLGEEAG